MRISFGKSTFISTPTLAPELDDELLELDDELLDEELVEDELDEELEVFPLEVLEEDELVELEEELLEPGPVQPLSRTAAIATAKEICFMDVISNSAFFPAHCAEP